MHFGQVSKGVTKGATTPHHQIMLFFCFFFSFFSFLVFDNFWNNVTRPVGYHSCTAGGKKLLWREVTTRMTADIRATYKVHTNTLLPLPLASTTISRTTNICHTIIPSNKQTNKQMNKYLPQRARKTNPQGRRLGA